MYRLSTGLKSRKVPGNNLRKAVKESEEHEYGKVLRHGGRDTAEGVQEQCGDQHHLPPLGVGQAAPEVGAEDHP